MTKKFFKALFLALFLIIIFFPHYANAECQEVGMTKLNVDNTWSESDDEKQLVKFSSGDINFQTYTMPCGAKTLTIQAVLPKVPKYLDQYNFTAVNMTQTIGKNVDSTKSSFLRLRAKIPDINNVNCSEPSFSGELCYPPPIPFECKRNCDEHCRKNTVVQAVVPIATALVGILGGTGGVLLKQYFNHRNRKHGKSVEDSTND